MIYNPSRARPYKRRGTPQRGRWEIDLRGVLDNGLEVKRERRVFPPSAKHDGVGKRQAQAMAREEFERWNRHGVVLRPGEAPPLPRTSGMKTGVAPTFKQFAPDFLEFCASPSASPRGANARSTIIHKESVLRVHLLPAFGSLRMDELTRRDIDRFVAAKLKAKLSINTIVLMLTNLRRMLSVAKLYEQIDKIPEFRIPASEPSRVLGLDPEEKTRFIASAWELYEARRSVLLELYLRTGLRCGEALGLRPADFDLDVERPLLRVERAWSDLGYGPPKGRKPRVVPLTHAFSEKVDALFKERGLSAREQELHPFSAERSMARPLNKNYVYDLVTRAGAAAKTRPLHTHMLRHTFGTDCARRGVPPLTIKEWMGHQKLDTTMVYIHLAAPDHLRWANLLDD